GESGVFEQRRLSQTAAWFEDLISEAVLSRFFQSSHTKQHLPELRKQVAEGRIPVALAVSMLLED
ncbi:MAG: methylmalonyl Co-A mutase-associated GTPase MeaB, partial [Candidatus Cloacimonadaceae bacterium]|nr:methylmalonyl Co-A mutase-associated GTPase MeaB [Candidatus Cloacimonadaceae bacterium]